MSQYSFIPGVRIRIYKAIHQLRRKLEGERWQLEKELDGELKIMTVEELLGLYREGNLQFVNFYQEGIDAEALEEKIKKNFGDYDIKLQQEARRRLGYIKALKDSSGTAATNALKKEAEKQKDSAPPSLSTVARWSTSLRTSHQDPCSLIPSFSSRGNKKARYPEEVAEIALTEIRRLYLNENKRYSINETLSAIQHMIALKNETLPVHLKLPVPQKKFVRNLIAAVDAYEIARARYGKRAADIRFREANLSGEIIMEPLERGEIDHTTLDLIVVDAETFLPLGRPVITVIIDRCTRDILGFHIGYDPASYVSVQKCLSHAIKPKDYVKKKYPDIVNDWPCWGLINLIVVDNAKEFHSRDFEAAMLNLLIEVRYCPVRQPWWKGSVERFLRTMNEGLIHKMPGTTFSDILEKGDYSSLKHAAVTQERLDELIHIWLCDVYHQTVHRSTLRTPAALWRMRIDASLQKLPMSTEMLDVNLGSIEQRTLFHYGISLNNLTYSSPMLQVLRRKYGQIEVQVKWDRSDLGYVHVLDEHAGEYLKVPCTWLSYASGLSLWLHKAIRKEALSDEGPESQAKLNAAKARIRAIFEESLSSKKLATRKTAARGRESFGNKSLATPVPDALPFIGSIEVGGPEDYEMVEIPNYKVRNAEA
ncbi:Mu transposase C-terminal domain-containing protein [Pelotalea chapellei]|uniref:DDE-type integrase/transposase/recombinase n=1 Tax=Pelotalea chapellei TaxID=44671 RepID=A0ABS5U4U8_9BACT|nr:Mu transposase C-terminal domain-containing protein [Pelotalea chapellei]MBT1070691.1 DDE-type integrase/transposase/recombinase [Pelotalea chapellei]